MTRHCSAGGCKSRDNRETRKAGITFHRLPKGATRRNLWITNSRRAASWDPQTDFVYFCSKHFTPESFELTGCSGIRRLKEDAFPTVFDSSSTAKCKRATTAKKKEDIPARKSPSSGDQDQQETDQARTSEEPAVQRSAPASQETHDNIPASSQELSQQDCAPSPPPEPPPLSPSHYMRRLPPPLGFYLPKEHSYAQLCPLLWRRRYDQAIDCLEKALRQLHAARRRENRLRSTVLRLREKQLKHSLLASQDGGKNRGNWTPGGERRRGRGGSAQEESESDAKSEVIGLFEDRSVDHFLPDTSSWSEEEKGYCFYCGRGQVQASGQITRRGSKTERHVQAAEHEDSKEIQRRVVTVAAENPKDVQIVRLEGRVQEQGETSDSDIAHSHVLLQTASLQQAVPAAASLPDTHQQSFQFSGSQQNLHLSDTYEEESEAAGQEHHLDLQQLFWIQDSTEGQVILVPVPAEDGLQSCLRMEGVVDETQTILVSELDLKRDLGQVTENSVGLARACEDQHSDLHSDINSSSVERREDVREKLKEHVEGFHLQLSTEFTN